MNRASLDRAWRRRLHWPVFGVGTALTAASRWWPVLLWPGAVLWISVGLINIGYGIAILRLLRNRRAERRAGAAR